MRDGNDGRAVIAKRDTGEGLVFGPFATNPGVAAIMGDEDTIVAGNDDVIAV